MILTLEQPATFQPDDKRRQNLGQTIKPCVARHRGRGPVIAKARIIPGESRADQGTRGRCHIRGSARLQIGRGRGKTRPPGDLGQPFDNGFDTLFQVENPCVRAGIPEWSPNQLRHNTATELRKVLDIDTARTMLGHSSIDVTEIYAEADREKAREAMRKVG